MLRVPSHVSGMRCVFAQNHVSERDSNISASLSLSLLRAKTQSIPDTWDGTLTVVKTGGKYKFKVKIVINADCIRLKSNDIFDIYLPFVY